MPGQPTSTPYKYSSVHFRVIVLLGMLDMASTCCGLDDRLSLIWFRLRVGPPQELLPEYIESTGALRDLLFIGCNEVV